MRANYSMLFWGLLLVILDFSINGFDLLPDGIGYLLVAAGCSGLATMSRQFTTAQTLSYVLAVLWLIGIFVGGQLGTLLALASTVLNCLCIWMLLGGIAEVATSRGRTDLAARARQLRMAYVVVMGIMTFAAWLLSGAVGGGLIVIGLVVALIIVMIMILILIHHAKHALAN